MDETAFPTIGNSLPTSSLDWVFLVLWNQNNLTFSDLPKPPNRWRFSFRHIAFAAEESSAIGESTQPRKRFVFPRLRGPEMPPRVGAMPKNSAKLQ